VKAALIQVAVAAFMAADSSHVSPGAAPPFNPLASLAFSASFDPDPRSSWTLALVPFRFQIQSEPIQAHPIRSVPGQRLSPT